MSNVIRQDVVELSFDIGNSLKELKKLQNDINDLKKKLTGGVGEEEFDDLKDSAEKAKKPIKNLTEETKKLKDKIVDVGKKAGTTAFNGLKKLASVSFKATIAGIGAASVAIGGLVAKAVSAYAEFEQLKGGVETLFGAKGAQSVEEYAKIMGKSVDEVQGEYDKLKAVESTVAKNANDAFKTAGLSANDYMQTVTSFSASLISSVGGDTEKAAELANMAIVDMSDNANKMGSDMGMLQNAYQGFAKQNYTMLDNLKLGYGGTKTEMERLIKDAAKMTDVQKKLGITVDASSMSYGNIVKAIHVMQEQMYINGTTQKEAEGTITGSLNMVKAAWGNLMPALIEGGDTFDQCIENLVYSADKFADNIMPAIEKALGGIGTLIEKLVPKLAEKFPEFAKKLIPPLIKAAVELAKGLIAALPEIIRTIAVTIVDIFGEQFPIIKKIGDFFSKNSDTIANSFKKLIPIVIALAAAFKGFKVVKGITSIFGGSKGGSDEKSGGLLGKLTNTFKDLAKTKPTVILKGMANLGIILGGFMAFAAIYTAVAPHIAKMGDMKSVLELSAIMVILGFVGKSLADFASVTGKIPVATVVKGLANMAIILGGTAIMTLIVGALSLIKFDYKKMLELTLIIGAIGTVGSILAVFAGIVGLIPFPVVLMGLANMATVLGGLTALVAAFGALNKIQGFHDFIKSGGEVLVTLFNIIGKCAGSIVGGVAEGITASLPQIGKDLSAFAENLQPAIAIFSTADMASIGSFFSSFGSFMLKMGAQEVMSFLTGGIDFAGTATGLNQLVDAKPFFEFCSSLPELALTNAEKFFNSIARISVIPNIGGVGQFFSGTQDYAGTATGLNELVKTRPFFDFCGGLPEIAFTNAESFFKCLADISVIPNVGGVAQFFSGTNDFSGTATGLKHLLKTESFFKMVSALPEASFANTEKLFQALAGIGKAFPNEGGLAQLFTGENDISGTGEKLKKFGADTEKFFNNVAEIDIYNLNSLWYSLQKAAYIATLDFDGLEDTGTKLSTFISNASTFLKNVSWVGKLDWNKFNGLWYSVQKAGHVASIDFSGFGSKGKELSNFITNAKKFFVGAEELVAHTGGANEIAKALKSFFEKIKGILNTDLSAIMDTSIKSLLDKVAKLPSLMARSFKGAGKSLGDAIVEVWKDAVKASVTPVNKLLDGANHILKEFGSSKRVITWKPYAKGTDGHKGGNAVVNDGNGAELVQMPNGRTFIPKGRNVFLPNAPKGMKVLNARKTAKLLGRSAPTFNYADGIGDIDIWSFYDNAKGLVSKLTENISYKGMSNLSANIGKGMVSTFSGQMAKWIENLFEEMGGMSIANYVPSKGVNQWRTTVIRALKMEGQYSAANVARTLYQMQTESGGNPRAINLWDINAKNGVPSKGLMQVIDPTFRAYARAGFDKDIYDPLSNILASIRYAVSRYGSLERAYRGVGYSSGVGEVSLPQPVSMQYTPDNSISGGRAEITENNTYSPVFNLTINGSDNERDIKRKIKRWVNEAFEEVLDSMSRKNPRLTEV